MRLPSAFSRVDFCRTPTGLDTSELLPVGRLWRIIGTAGFSDQKLRIFTRAQNVTTITVRFRTSSADEGLGSRAAMLCRGGVRGELGCRPRETNAFARRPFSRDVQSETRDGRSAQFTTLFWTGTRGVVGVEGSKRADHTIRVRFKQFCKNVHWINHKKSR